MKKQRFSQPCLNHLKALQKPFSQFCLSNGHQQSYRRQQSREIPRQCPIKTSIQLKSKNTFNMHVAREPKERISTETEGKRFFGKNITKQVNNSSIYEQYLKKIKQPSPLSKARSNSQELQAIIKQSQHLSSDLQLSIQQLRLKRERSKKRLQTQLQSQKMNQPNNLKNQQKIKERLAKRLQAKFMEI